jgi:hypothetical protein
MRQVVALVLVALTSLGMLALGTRRLGLRRALLGPAIGKTLECIGTMLAFYAANVALGLLAILVGRSLTGTFVSSYSTSDVGLLALSFLQGLFFHCWGEVGKGGRHPGSGRGEEVGRRTGIASGGESS